jgi:hypothetical protein
MAYEHFLQLVLLYPLLINNWVNTNNRWVSGLSTSFKILNTRKHNASEIGPESVLRLGKGDTKSLESPKKS